MTSYLFTGGTGLIGRAIIRKLQNDPGNVSESTAPKICVLTRNKVKAEQRLGSKIRYVECLTELPPQSQFDIVINLAGEPIADKRWSKKQKQKIWQSRVTLTQDLVSWLAKLNQPPRKLISGSAIGWYGDGKDSPLDESSAPHQEYTHTLCEAWERAAKQALDSNIALDIIRTGLVVSPEGGVLSKLVLPFKLGLGARLGNGQQYMSWIHIDDYVDALCFIMASEEISCKTYNFTSPNPVTNQAFTKALAKVFNRPAFLVAPGVCLKLALGEMSRLLLTGQRVMPKHLLDLGFQFTYPLLPDALNHVFEGAKGQS